MRCARGPREVGGTNDVTVSNRAKGAPVNLVDPMSDTPTSDTPT